MSVHTDKKKKKSVKIPERGDIDSDMKWDLSALYNDFDEWEKDFNKIDAYKDKILSFKGKLGKSEKKICKIMSLGDELGRLMSNLAVYVHLKGDEDLSNSGNQAYAGRFSAKSAELDGFLAWIEPELLSISEKKFLKFMNSEKLKFYRRSLSELNRSRKYMLSDKEERILAKSSEIFSAPSRIFSMFNNADLSFPKLKDENGRKVQLTHGNYIKFLKSEKRKVRKSAYKKMYKTFTSFKNTCTAMLESEVKSSILNAELRNFNSTLEASLHPDNIPLSVYNKLIDSVRSYLPKLHHYFKIRAEMLKMKRLRMFDIYNPLVPGIKVNYSWQEAVEIVKEAIKPLGPEYCSIADEAFEKQWVDVYENRGKRSGAYSGGSYDSPPYILMNFSGTLNDVFTLAHELGHSIHSHYSRQAQEFRYARYRIFVAEVASTTNELLLNSYLYNSAGDNKKFKLYLLNDLIDSYRTTVFRQTMFAEFEKLIHETVENKSPLTSDFLCREYGRLNSEYHGDFVKNDNYIPFEWSRIPHFYYNFYVYKYATGFSAAVKLSENILKNENLNSYMDFLKAGDSKDVIDIMKDTGVDLTEKNALDDALNKFSELINLFDEQRKSL